jgi:hypothetical protein
MMIAAFDPENITESWGSLGEAWNKDAFARNDLRFAALIGRGNLRDFDCLTLQIHTELSLSAKTLRLLHPQRSGTTSPSLRNYHSIAPLLSRVIFFSVVSQFRGM